MPNAIDLDVVYTEIKRLDKTGNVAVLGTIMAVLLLYLLAVIFARRADRRDMDKVPHTRIAFIRSIKVLLLREFMG